MLIPDSPKWQKVIDSYQIYLDGYEKVVIHREELVRLQEKIGCDEWNAHFLEDKENDLITLHVKERDRLRSIANEDFKKYQAIKNSMAAEMGAFDGNQENWEWESKKQSEFRRQQDERYLQLLDRFKRTEVKFGDPRAQCVLHW